MTQEHAAAAFHAAKMAQLNAMGHNLDKLPTSLLPSHLDLSKVNSHHNSSDLSRIQSTGSVTIEPANPKVPTSLSHNAHDRADIIRRDSEPMDLGYDNQQQQHNNMNDRDNSSGEEDNYSDDDGEQNT